MQIWKEEPAWRLRFACREDAPEGAGGEALQQRPLALGASPLLWTGLGPRAELNTLLLRRAAAKAVKTARSLGAGAAVLLAGEVEGLGPDGLRALVMGARLALLEPESYAEKKPRPAFALYLDPADAPDAEMVLAESDSLVAAIRQARDLTNRPANRCTPALLAEAMQTAAGQAGVDCTVLDEGQIKALGMEALGTVGESAQNPPRLIVLRYNGAPHSPHRLALVGKGITCDTGGYCLKPAASMGGIRGDMAGGAAVCGAVLALAEQRARANVVAVVPAAENRISSGSYTPGDVIGCMAGKSIYIGNTDAEGRLLLADALCYAIEREGATHLVDAATLTGACYGFFGHIYTAMMSTSDALAARLLAAGEASDEKIWRVPVDKAYREMLDSPYADISNMSKGGCGTLTAGMFLEAFTQGLPWAHLDIAGTAWVDEPKLEYHAAGATGAMVETLYRLCSGWEAEG